MIIQRDIDLEKELTTEQMHVLETLKDSPAIPDADCPELTLEQLNQFSRVAKERRQERKTQTVTIRLSPQALEKAKSLGKGYTSVLSRILENALNDIELIKQNL